jgi:hypothetical protein
VRVPPKQTMAVAAALMTNTDHSSYTTTATISIARHIEIISICMMLESVADDHVPRPYFPSTLITVVWGGKHGLCSARIKFTMATAGDRHACGRGREGMVECLRYRGMALELAG